jgi:uric acid-xanthine permease
LKGFFSAIELVMETGFAVTAFLSLILNLVIPEEDDDEVVDITANTVEQSDDEKEWERIRRPSQMRRSQEVRMSQDVESSPSGSVEKQTEAAIKKE